MQNMLRSGAQISGEDTIIFAALHTIVIYRCTKYSGKLLWRHFTNILIIYTWLHKQQGVA